jgi:hypothetical protein
VICLQPTFDPEAGLVLLYALFLARLMIRYCIYSTLAPRPGYSIYSAFAPYLALYSIIFSLASPWTPSIKSARVKIGTTITPVSLLTA